VLAAKIADYNTFRDPEVEDDRYHHGYFEKKNKYDTENDVDDTNEINFATQ
jgi:restriction endonuclease